MPEINKDQRYRRQCDEGVNQSAAHKDTEPIREIAHRFREKRIDLPLADVGGDLPFVFCRRDEIAHQNREQVIIDHRAIVVTVQPAASLFEDGAPEKNGAGQWNQREERAQEIIPAINKRVLQPKIKDADVLVDLHGAKIRLLMKAGAQEIQTLIRCSGGL